MGPSERRAGGGFPSVPEVIFTNWRETLNAAALPGAVRAGYTLTVAGYLDYCRRNGISVTLESARGYMADVTRRGLARNPPLWKQGLNWYFGEGRKTSGRQLRGVPSVGQADTGKTDWERRMIERLRLGQYAWRTEQTYREWAWWFAGFVGEGSLESATGEEIKSFLTRLAVKGRVSVATQRQALNALVFLFREVLGRDPGDFSGFGPSRRGPRLPAVLTREECGRLFAAPEGTTRLMAELMYGSGLRLNELLRLRVKDVDLERGQLIVRAGKGDKDIKITWDGQAGRNSAT